MFTPDYPNKTTIRVDIDGDECPNKHAYWNLVKVDEQCGDDSPWWCITDLSVTRTYLKHTSHIRVANMDYARLPPLDYDKQGANEGCKRLGVLREFVLENLPNLENVITDFLNPQPFDDSGSVAADCVLNSVGFRSNSVRKIVIYNTGMTGNLSALDSLGEDYPFLRHLNISGHGSNVYGGIPMLSLPYLTHLDLSDNNLTSIDDVDWSTLSNITHLDLSRNPHLVGSFDPVLNNLPSLEFLRLDGTQLAGDVSTISSLSGLSSLRYVLGNDSNGLINIPTSASDIGIDGGTERTNVWCGGVYPREDCYAADSNSASLRGIKIMGTMMGGDVVRALRLDAALSTLHLERTEFRGDIARLKDYDELTYLRLEGNLLHGDESVLWESVCGECKNKNKNNDGGTTCENATTSVSCMLKSPYVWVDVDKNISGYQKLETSQHCEWVRLDGADGRTPKCVIKELRTYDSGVRVAAPTVASPTVAAPTASSPT
jgi:Leucine-rich repeat (LRR) protein